MTKTKTTVAEAAEPETVSHAPTMTTTMTAATMTAAAATAHGEPTDDALSSRRPMVRATRITLFEREVRERLSRAALDVMFARAESISEGQSSARGGREAYFGSTMLTIDLVALADVLRDVSDVGTPDRLVTLMESDKDLPARIREIAAREATRIAVRKLRELTTHVTIRAQGSKIFIDVDVEAS
jgi:hypothetical protein